MFEEAFRQSDLLNLATCIESHHARSSGIRLSPDKSAATLAGTVTLSHDGIGANTEATCWYFLHHDWVNVPPVVRCREPWVRKGDPDWHVSKEGVLCYDLDLRWQREVGTVMSEEGMRAASAFAAAWCVHHSKWLLLRHRFAYENNIRSWPKDWPAWKHGEQGRREYRRELRYTREEAHGT